jgi:hypothetical protein
MEGDVQEGAEVAIATDAGKHLQKHLQKHMEHMEHMEKHMEDDIEKLTKLVKTLAKKSDDGFLQLGRALRSLQEIDSQAFADAAVAAKIGRRRAYYLASISRAFDGLAIPDARLNDLGWTKLQIIAPSVSAANVSDLVALAEQCTAHELESYVKELPDEGDHCVLLRMSEADHALFVLAMTAHGAVKSGRGLAGKQDAFRSLLKAAAAGLGDQS